MVSPHRCRGTSAGRQRRKPRFTQDKRLERIIPLHLALIKTGLLKFVATMKSGPLFALLSPDAPAERAGPEQNLTLPDGRIEGCPAGSRRRVLLALPSCKFYPGAACGWTAAADSGDPPRPRAGLRSVDFAPCPFRRFGCCDFRTDRSASLTCSRSLSNSRN